MIELFETRYHYIQRAEQTILEKQPEINNTDLFSILTDNSDLSKVFRDWCEVDMQNLYFFLHYFLVEKDHTKRFLLD